MQPVQIGAIVPVRAVELFPLERRAQQDVQMTSPEKFRGLPQLESVVAEERKE